MISDGTCDPIYSDVTTRMRSSSLYTALITPSRTTTEFPLDRHAILASEIGIHAQRANDRVRTKQSLMTQMKWMRWCEG